MFDIVIIGAGPAGLSAAIYGARAGKKVLVLEANMYGGQIINSSLVENYPGVEPIDGYTFVKNLYNQAINSGAKVKYERVTKIELNKVITNKNEYDTKTIIIASGLKKRNLGIDNEKELIGKGISYCATCDGNFYKNKEVAIVGGGNTAIEEALYLSDIVKKLYIIHRRDEFSADEVLIKNLKKKKNIEFKLNNEIKAINGNKKIESITLKNDEIINIDCLFVAIGQVPDNEFIGELIATNKMGYINSKDCRTKESNIFVAGDCRTKEVRQLITATSDGAMAASYAVYYINNNE